MAKKKSKKSANKKTAISSQKPVEKKETKKCCNHCSIVAISVIVIIIAAGVASYFIFFADSRATSFNKAVNLISEIDEAHQISFDSYEKGIYYLESHPRYPNPFNFNEMDQVISEYSALKADDKAANLYIDFRINLLEAEKYYRLSKKSARSDIHLYGIRCRDAPIVVESIHNIYNSIDELNQTFETLMKLKEKYPKNYNSLELSEEFVDKISKESIDFEAEITFKTDNWKDFCDPLEI